MRSLLFVLLLASGHAFGADDVFVGWVSDSSCASARASNGKYTATNPECARRCVKEGKDVVLIDPETKAVYSIENQAALKSQVGNKVQVYARKTGNRALHVEKVTFLEEANPECERPPLKD